MSEVTLRVVSCRADGKHEGGPVSLHRNDDVWQQWAACRGPHQAIFFPPPRLERRSEKRLRERRAKEICGSCSVQKECLEYALAIREQHGIWGGLTENERREIVIREAVPAPTR